MNDDSKVVHRRPGTKFVAAYDQAVCLTRDDKRGCIVVRRLADNKIVGVAKGDRIIMQPVDD
jgi:hypothetical protein